MVGSTGTIKTMRLLRNKQHHNNKRVEESAATIDNSSSTTIAAAAAAAVTMDASGHKNNKRHNASITSNTSSVSSTSSTASSATSSSTSSSRHHHHHQRSLSMRDHYLDLPYDDATAPADQQPAIAYRQSPASVWVFPPLPPQPNLYCNSTQDALIQFEKAGLKGFRKQFSGRFKRFVLRKPAEPAPAIPPELKCQLKSIYVY